MTNEEFATWLQREIETRGWSQAEFARRGGISTQLVSVVLSQQQNPGLRMIQGTAKAFGISQGEVMEKAGKMPNTGPILPAVADINKRLLALDETQRVAAIRALNETLRAIESVVRLSSALVV